MNILKFIINDQEIDMYVKNGSLAYTFEGTERRFENAIKIPSRKTEDIVAAAFLLFTNAQEAIHENNRLSAGTTAN